MLLATYTIRPCCHEQSVWQSIRLVEYKLDGSACHGGSHDVMLEKVLPGFYLEPGGMSGFIDYHYKEIIRSLGP